MSVCPRDGYRTFIRTEREEVITGNHGNWILQGTLALMIFKTLETAGAQHGFGIARGIEQASRGSLRIHYGTLYAALVRLQKAGWLTAKWGTSENNRRAKFYRLTSGGRRRLVQETLRWTHMAAVMDGFLKVRAAEAE